MEQQERVVSSLTEARSAEERMLRAELVQEVGMPGEFCTS